MKSFLFCIIGIFFVARGSAQMSYNVDTSQHEIKEAVLFLTGYLNEFKNQKLPDFSKYWSAEDCKRSGLPDAIAYSITTDVVTYNFGQQQQVFYARVYKNYVHLKTIFSTLDSQGGMTIWAITNHYVFHDPSGKVYFKSELELHKGLYAKITNRNITYHFPKTHKFDIAKSKELIQRLQKIENKWGFKPVKLDYYFADSRDELMHMQNMDYCFGMDGPEPNGMSFPEISTIFCQGLGEGYLHEVLHLYFNPQYASFPACHGLIYYLAGGIGHDFNWMIKRMNVYLGRYPELDLSDYSNLVSKDKMLHIDHVTMGLLCKMVDEKEGVKGLRRLLSYKTADEIFEKEFRVSKKDRNAFLRQNFRKYAGLK